MGLRRIIHEGKRGWRWNVALPLGATNIGHNYTSTRTNERTNEGTNERTNERRNERTNERMNERTKERTNERTNERTTRNVETRSVNYSVYKGNLATCCCTYRCMGLGVPSWRVLALLEPARTRQPCPAELIALPQTVPESYQPLFRKKTNK